MRFSDFLQNEDIEKLYQLDEASYKNEIIEYLYFYDKKKKKIFASKGLLIEESTIIYIEVKKLPNISIFQIYKKLISNHIIIFRGNTVEILKLYYSILKILDIHYSDSCYEFWNFVSYLQIELSNGNFGRIDIKQNLNVENYQHFNKNFYIKSLISEICCPLFFFSQILRFESNYVEFFDPPFYKENTFIFDPFTLQKIKLYKGVFVPDTRVLILLVSALLEKDSILKKDLYKKYVAEPCTGSGIISLILSSCKPQKIYCTDIHDNSVKSAKHNLMDAEPNVSIKVEKYDGLNTAELYDVIVFNPPWYSSSHRYTSRNRLRCFCDNNFSLLDRLLNESKSSAKSDASLYIFHGKEDPFKKYYSRIYINTIDYGWEITNSWKYPFYQPGLV